MVGGVWVAAGLLKLGDPTESVRAVRAYDLLPSGLVSLVGHGLPTLEIVVGLCLLLGLLTRPAAVASAVLLVAFVVGISAAWARGLSIECGCFGGGGGPAPGASDKYPWEIARDVGLLLLSALLVGRPRTPYALDAKVLAEPEPEPAPSAAAASRSRTSSKAAAIRHEAQVEAARRRGRTVTAVGVAILALVVAIGTSVQGMRDSTGVSSAVPSGVVDRYAVPYGGGSDPKVVVDVYEDFMCPFCGQLEQGSGTLVSDFAGRGVQFRYHVVAFLDRASSKRYSTRAMNAYGAVLAAAGPDVAKKFHDALYFQQPEEGSAGLTDDQLVQLAVAAGAEESAVEKPIRDLEYAQWVKNATDAASRAKVTGTPTVEVDGKRLPPAYADQTLAAMRAAIEKGLQ